MFYLGLISLEFIIQIVVSRLIRLLISNDYLTGEWRSQNLRPKHEYAPASELLGLKSAFSGG